MLINKKRSPITSCKCCNKDAHLWDVCDFHNHCHQPHLGIYAPLASVEIYFYRCLSCGFIFTTDFDHFSQDDFKKYIYNEDYPKLDIDYATKRPIDTFNLLDTFFKDYKQDLDILDYGGGSGYLEQILKEHSYSATTYEPFNDKISTPLQNKYQIVTAIEIVEHVHNPLAIFEHMMSYLDIDNGVILISTVLQPPNIETIKTAWQYMNPKGGHISFYTQECLISIFNEYGLKFYTNGSNFHIAYKNAPSFANKLAQYFLSMK